MRHTYLAAGVFAVVFIGVLLFTHYDRDGAERIADDTGTYAYTCSRGASLSMTPSADMRSIVLKPGANAAFREATIVQKDANTFGTGDVTLYGVGEHIRVYAEGTTYECDPVPSQTEAPFNWGDPAEGAGQGQDMSAAVISNIVGKWRSTEDPLFIREFFADGSVVDSYDDENPLRQSWRVFTKADTADLSVTFTPIEGTVYVAIFEGNTELPLYFSVDKVTPETLEMTYMDRGNSLKFTRVQ